MMLRYAFSAGLVVSMATLAAAQPAAAPPPAGDHGMVLAAAMEVAPGKLKDTIKRSDTKNYVFRGKWITLNKERTIHMCFDTELMRVAGVWKGPYPGGMADKNMGPTVEGTMLLQSPVMPGWARKGDWKDPRDGQEGPLPAEWTRYRGMYLHGDRVILSYTVGDVDVLDSTSRRWQRRGWRFVLGSRFVVSGPMADSRGIALSERQLA